MPESSPRIGTSTVGSYPTPPWLLAQPLEQAVLDATRVVFDTQRQAGIELITDGELSRFDVNHPETNGMIDYFVRPLGGTRSQLGRRDADRFRKQSGMGFRSKPAAVVEGPLGEGSLDLPSDCGRAASLLDGHGHGARGGHGGFKFTMTSPYMLARTLLDEHYGGFEPLLDGLAEVLAGQAAEVPADVLQVDEANLPGRPEDGPAAAAAVNRVLDAFPGPTAVHLCFGNYGGQTIQGGTWAKLIEFLNELHVGHLVLELAHRPPEDLEALKEVKPEIGLGIGVIDIKVNPVESPDEVARRIERAEQVLGGERVQWVHPDCGLWMLPRPVADRKLRSLVEGRDRYLG